MLGRLHKQREQGGEGSQPLLGRSEDESRTDHEDSVLFSVDDEDDDDLRQTSALDPAPSPPPKGSHSVRFEEDVQVIGPPLRSTLESREVGA